jgi:hypothetical protein
MPQSCFPIQQVVGTNSSLTCKSSGEAATSVSSWLRNPAVIAVPVATPETLRKSLLDVPIGHHPYKYFNNDFQA